MQVRFGQGLDFARFSTSVKNLIYRRLAPTIVLSLDFLSSFNSSPGPRPNNISSLHQINQGFFTQKKTKVSAEKPGAKEPPYPVESPSPPALPPCSARNAPASSSRPAGHTENPNVPRLALSTWSPRRGVVENIWRWATNLFMVWNGMIYEIYLGVECHIYATKLYATYMPHSYMGVGYVECICYISIDISKNWPASMVGWAPPRIVFPSGSCLPFSKCSAASYWIHVEAKLEADPKLNPWYFMILHHIRIINIYLSIYLFQPSCGFRSSGPVARGGTAFPTADAVASSALWLHLGWCAAWSFVSSWPKCTSCHPAAFWDCHVAAPASGFSEMLWKDWSWIGHSGLFQVS